jgi:hypothetical protein
MFEYFSKINYNFGTTGGVKPVMDIFKSINVNLDSDLKLIKQTNTVKERPEQMSRRIYGIFNYYWILLLVNNIKNPLTGWSSLKTLYNLSFGNASLFKNKIENNKNRSIKINLSEL